MRLIVIGAQQQEEQDRKVARLKEMEVRRQAVLQKKVEEGKVKANDEERKVKEDAGRRKKEREENTGKRPLVRTDSKVSFGLSMEGNTNQLGCNSLPKRTIQGKER